MSYIDREKRMQRTLDMGFLDESDIGNDMVFFKRKLKDVRFQIALSLGWQIKHINYEDKDYYELIAPYNYECSLNNWASIYTKLDVDGEQIGVPNYYFDNTVLLTGKY